MSDTDHQQHHPNPAQDQGDAGYAKNLKRRHIQMIAIGGSIGTGLFLGAGGRMAQGGPGLAFAYLVCGIVAFLMVRALGELAVRRPSSGAFVSYAREFLGEGAAFYVGWFFFIGWAVAIMADITAIALYMHYWHLFGGVPQWLIALIALALVLILNVLNVKMFGEAEFWFSIIKVGTIIIFMVIALWAVLTQHSLDGTPAGFHNITENGGFFPKGFMAVFALTLGVIFAFGGTEMVGVAAGEAKDASKVLPKAINSMIIRILVFYVGSVVMMALVLPYTMYSSSESPFVTFFDHLGVAHAGDVVQIVVLTAAFSSLNAALYAVGRTLRNMAVSGSAPHFAAKLNKNRVPANGIIMTCAFGSFGVLLNIFLPGDAFDIVMNLAGIGFCCTWSMILISHLAFLRKAKRGEVERPSYRMPGAPYTNYIAIIFYAVVVLSNLSSTAGRWTLGLYVILMVLLTAYWFHIRGRVYAKAAADKEKYGDRL
ncbi:MAG: amino acid permease [Corynebacterium sp.]|nr:amino acid permease [Corynebacterium sp.]